MPSPHKAKDRMQGLVDTNFKLYKRITDDDAFSKALLDMLFTMFRARAKGGAEG